MADTKKAYNQVKWNFLSSVLKHSGFHEKFIKWIKECALTPVSVLVSGSPSPRFSSSFGLRQGCLLSPFFLFFFLLILCSDILFKTLHGAVNGNCCSYWCQWTFFLIFLFADDLYSGNDQ